MIIFPNLSVFDSVTVKDRQIRKNRLRRRDFTAGVFIDDFLRKIEALNLKMVLVFP